MSNPEPEPVDDEQPDDTSGDATVRPSTIETQVATDPEGD